MKVIAMYLPQFHRVKENDEWWGEGFTEWTAVKQAKPLFAGHDQPRKPLHGDYYDLMKKETMIQQADYMHEYGIDAMCFYHYYFKDGKKILEKPAENLLKWKDIDMPFCFSWANESWTRTWSNINDGNTWMTNTAEKTGQPSDDSGILLEQKYGNEADWEAHFYYLLPFFLDERYLKIDGHPVFVVYKARLIYCLKEMLETWNYLAQKEGIPSICLIGSNIRSEQEEYLDYVLIHEPQDTLFKYFIGHTEWQTKVRQYSYDDVWKKLLSKPIVGEKICRGAFVRHDTTPRRGEGGIIVTDATPQKFQQYLSALLADARQKGCEYVFVNAWNEWGEGMYLEPDEKDQFGYLEAVKQAKESLEHTENIESPQTDEASMQVLMDEIVSLEKDKSRYKNFFKILNSWMNLKENHKNISNFLKGKEITHIAVYGIGMLGKHLIRELADSDIKIVYGIDKKAQSICQEFPVYTMDEPFEAVDAIIVTVGDEFEKIKHLLKYKVDCEILSLGEVIDETDKM